ncbi:hypothetical protein Pint_31748 [Pistacia integerrima]|uniref:Uncharacterized protein n=1 Tax=Pistacia integerrima TaxID=434235 RepID=A0ACC0XPD0_9ROSI|nr:hypothetical protein Pint_31748 [Pistacia integerrima]
MIGGNLDPERKRSGEKMGIMLKEVLKAFCSSNQWSYSVFWKIGCHNTKLLIWEEHYNESSLNPKVPFGEWEGCWGSSEISSSQLGNQAGDRVQQLINKMMLNNHVHVLGEGIVGRAAFTGNHQWILANNHIREAHPLEVQNEVHLQFSAGMQTVAVIPVHPHGVVQFGSSLAIMENIEFVNYVKNIILQLGCVPGALLSEHYGAKESDRKLGVPVSSEMPVSVDPSGIYKVTSSTPVTAGSYNQQSSSSQPSRLGGQVLGCLGKQIQHNVQATASTFQTPNVAQTSVKSHDDHCEPKFSQVLKPNLPFGDQLGNGGVDAEVIPTNSDVWLNQQASLCNSRTAFNYQPTFDLSSGSCSSLKSVEQILTDAAVRGHVTKNANEVNGDRFVGSQLRKIGGLNGGSVPTQLLEGSELCGGMIGQISSNSLSCSKSNPQKLADSNLYGSHLAGTGIKNCNSSKVEEFPLSGLVDQLTMSHMLSGGSSLSDVKHGQNDLASMKERVSNDMFQAFNNHHPHESMLLSGQIPGFIYDCQKHDNADTALRSINAKFEDGFGQPPSGDDLFDVLGVDFKNKLLNGNWNHFHADGQNLGKGSSMCLNEPDVNSDFYSVNEGLSNTVTFSGMGTEHLLDAVVSRAHSSAKQISDDNMSCRTTVSKICSSSIPGTSPSCGQVNLSNLVQGELFGLPKSMAKVGTVGSTSFQSGCSKDDGASCSQTTSIYGSHISSWVEQGHSVKRDGSVSTAYSKRNDEMTKSNRKRLKPGENPRPRPKDRQMIQDRVKELREIVPNGAKCSIDALLERTIKHMLFLQSVTKHADKFKQTGESKVQATSALFTSFLYGYPFTIILLLVHHSCLLPKKFLGRCILFVPELQIINKEGGLLLKDNFEGGATWAFEVGSQSMVCPIIVEDLNPPRQMLVEMLCEERGFFLEIADLIRGLGLTILKGVMETRNNKIWARFAVEANRDVTRMEIFMSLVRLLEQTVKGNTSANALDKNMMVHHSFPEATSIPATGRPSSLQ